jgi:hypothetical protein
MNIIDTLIEFIKRAERDRKYPPNTAVAFKRPFLLIASELTNEEKTSLETFESRIDQILNSVYTRGNSNLSASSLEEYKRRIRRVISNYKEYGIDPSKMASWNRVSKIRKIKDKSSNQDKSAAILMSSADNLTRFELPLTSGKAIIFTPPTLKKSDVNKIKAYVRFLEESLLDEDKNETGEG